MRANRLFILFYGVLRAQGFAVFADIFRRRHAIDFLELFAEIRTVDDADTGSDLIDIVFRVDA